MTLFQSAISPTALLVADWRGFSNIPYAHAIARNSYAAERAREALGLDYDQFKWLAPVLESRHNAIETLIDRYRDSEWNLNILELACGVSPRRLIRTDDPSVFFVATDFPDILEESRMLFKRVSKKRRNNLHHRPVDVRNGQQLQAAASFLPHGTITIVSEGLLIYLSQEEKAIMAGHIHRLLSEHGGVWITSDITEKGRIKVALEADPNLALLIEALYGLTGCDFLANSFDDFAAALAFYNQLGFTIEQYTQAELTSNLTSLTRVGADPKKVNAMLSQAVVWALKPTA